MKNANVARQIDLAFIQLLLREAGRFALEQQSQLSHRWKQDGSLITDVDVQIEAFLVHQIAKRYPEHQIIAEEDKVINTKSAAYRWIIDPLEGSRVYYQGLPSWGILLGIMSHERLGLGVFYLPRLDEMYVGTDKDAYLNGKRMLPITPLDLDDPTTFLAVPAHCHEIFDIKIKQLRSFGGLAAHLASVARGVAFGAVTQHASLRDVAGMLPILQAVGVKAKYLSGEKFRVSDLVLGPSTKPLVFAHSSVIDGLRERINLKNPSRPIVS